VLQLWFSPPFEAFNLQICPIYSIESYGDSPKSLLSRSTLSCTSLGRRMFPRRGQLSCRSLGTLDLPLPNVLYSVSTHHNMIVDPAVLASMFPHQRPLHYWAKDSLFQNPVGKYILEATGNIPVNRRSKDNAVLFKGTFKALSSGEVVALFPEGAPTPISSKLLF
jgi:1-acyl-sn-glycerol-3-phosphate acyltransferase